MPKAWARRWFASVSTLARTTDPSRAAASSSSSGAELAAGTAPLGPEVDDDRQLRRALDDLGFEGRLVDVDDRHAANYLNR